MSFLYQTVSFNDNLSLPHLLPKPLKSDCLYEAFVRSLKKKEVDLEFKGLLLSQREPYLNILNRLENRFWVYDKESPIVNKSFRFRYKGFDVMSKQPILADRQQTKTLSNSLIDSYNARKYSLQHQKENCIVKSRPLSLTKAGLELSFNGKRVLLSNSKVFKKGNIPYKFWLIINLKSLAQLNSFKLQKWEVNSIAKNMDSCDHQNDLWTSYILLAKNK